MEKREGITSERLGSIVDRLIDSYRTLGGINHIEGPNHPSQESIRQLSRVLLEIIFPGYYEDERVNRLNLRYSVGLRANFVAERLVEEITKSIHFANRAREVPCPSDPRSNPEGYAMEVVLELLEGLPDIRTLLQLDAEAALRGDPAAGSLAEVLLSYPGLRALAIHRVAHFLYSRDIPLIPRMMSEFVHADTGIDIHPGATIGDAFFIDHGTGVVIGETCVIGDHVKVYQGVTMGALSVPDERRSSYCGKKRHPTIEDHVTIYAGATILGGDTVIGTGSIIGGNVWLTHSVPAGTKVLLEKPKLRFEQAQKS